MQCIKLDKPLSTSGKFLTLTACRNAYHLDKSCSGVENSIWGGMGIAKKNGWKRVCFCFVLHHGVPRVATVSFALVEGPSVLFL